MRLTLDIEDLAVLLSSLFNQDIEANQLDIENDPFGIAITGLSVTQLSEAITELEKKKTTPAEIKTEKQNTTEAKQEETIPVVTLNDKGQEASNVDMSKILSQNRSLTSKKVETPQVGSRERTSNFTSGSSYILKESELLGRR